MESTEFHEGDIKVILKHAASLGVHKSAPYSKAKRQGKLHKLGGAKFEIAFLEVA